MSIKDTSRNEISIDTLKKKDVKLPKKRVVPNKPSPLQSFMMAQSTKKKRLAFHKHTLDKDHKMSVLQRIGQLPQDQCIIENLHLNTKSTSWDHHFHYIYTITRKAQGNNKIHKWYGKQWELTQTQARDKANKSNGQCKDDQ